MQNNTSQFISQNTKKIIESTNPAIDCIACLLACKKKDCCKKYKKGKRCKSCPNE
jgi:hypothetical protein